MHTNPTLRHPEPTDSQLRAAIADTLLLAHFAGRMGWVPATSGNFSVRLDDNRCAITASGGFKGEITSEQVMIVDIGELGDPHSSGCSAEAALHLQLYRDLPEIGAVAHVHSHTSTIMSHLYEGRGYLDLEGWELLKAFRGIETHETRARVPVFGNDQQVDRLAKLVHEQFLTYPGIPGYLIAGHGLYAWGEDAAETRRHLEAFDALLQLQLEEGRHR
ncbi:MAG: methylthioribulose 1-phosphate dehydratase [Chloroflexota bacterium]